MRMVRRTLSAFACSFPRSRGPLPVLLALAILAVSCGDEAHPNAPADDTKTSAVAGSSGSRAAGGGDSGTAFGPDAAPIVSPTAGSPSGTRVASRAGEGGGAGGSSGAAGDVDVAATAGTPATAGTGGAASGPGADSTCSRELLKNAVEDYFTALAAHEPSMAPLAPSAKITENGMRMNVGEGMWTTAGKVKFKRTLLDDESCNSVTESVVPEGSTDRLYGLRLKLEGQLITEVETIVVREGDYLANNPMGLADSASDDWETPLRAAEQTPRDQIENILKVYIEAFPQGGCGFGDECERLENGGSFGSCVDGLIVSCNPNAMGRADGMKARLVVADTTAGTGAVFTMFQGTYTDFHMLQFQSGEVIDVHATLARASSSGWE